SVTEYGITIRRVLDAPRERVWQEWTEPERFADWFGGPEAEIPLETVTMDVRPGGTWRATMFFGPDRRVIRWKGEYFEVVAPERRGPPGRRDSTPADRREWPHPWQTSSLRRARGAAGRRGP